MLDSPRKPSSTMRIFSSAGYCRRVARRMSRMAFLALSFFFVIIVPLLSYDELKHSLIQTPFFVQLSLTANNQQTTTNHVGKSGQGRSCVIAGNKNAPKNNPTIQTGVSSIKLIIEADQ